MAIRNIIKIGHPTLNEISEPIVLFKEKYLCDLISDLCDTLDFANGSGLAAPQINVSKRVIVFGSNNPLRRFKLQVIPRTVLINPEYIVLDKTIINNPESCLSIPGFKANIKRYKTIQYCGYTINNEYYEIVATDWHAALFQHELDHLNGILLINRVENQNDFGYEKT